MESQRFPVKIKEQVTNISKKIKMTKILFMYYFLLALLFFNFKNDKGRTISTPYGISLGDIIIGESSRKYEYRLGKHHCLAETSATGHQTQYSGLTI